MRTRLRPTISADGVPRATLQPRFRISYDLLLDLIAGCQPLGGAGGHQPDRPDWAAAYVRKVVDAALVEGGYHASRGVYDQLDEDDAAWCRRMADKVWPAPDSTTTSTTEQKGSDQ